MEAENKIVKVPGSVHVQLDVYLFMEGGCYIAYSPALDLSGYGNSEEEAKQSFDVTIGEYIAYGISKRTLVKDLRALGWKVKSLRQRKMAAPSFENLVKSNETFKDILENKEYRKIYEPFPVIA